MDMGIEELIKARQFEGKWPGGRKPKLYKYMQREHAENLLRNGSLLLSPLTFYTNQESLGDEVGDASEGVASFVYKEPGRNSPIPRNPRFVDVGINVESHDNLFIGQTHCRPSFIWCVTTEISKNMVSHFGSVALEVLDAKALDLAVSKALFQRGLYIRQSLHGPVKYGDKIIRFGPNAFDPGPAFHKHQRYSYQKEYRFLWEMRHEIKRVFVKLEEPQSVFRLVPESEF